ncbi:hypothetical protein GCM10007301_02330 [Azorhizobium oxalatiphilum]|uniref:Uncharacterized protein n=1 Tax=Azorhizobium oxalatiphilum TaxID=980631 RepID=A0A917BKD2_9HYPH|nr:hypothetical protein [Azorhizobium oxalatiphilum]GGF46370.1 hypothetical protein GCM10007301_02330 [Azorhizobium oxalatiphilum]
MNVTPDPERLAIIAACMDSYDVGEADAEWPNNIISRFAAVHGDGTIARQGEAVAHEVDAAEVALCAALAMEAAGLMGEAGVGMGSEADDPFRPFSVPGGPAPAIDEALVRARFGGTLFPQATLTVEPLAEDTVWWREVLADGEGMDDAYFAPWRAMMDWFRRNPAFVATAFVRIGDAQALYELPEAAYPPGTVITGCCLPRLALGLTPKGSLTGLFGHVVRT